MAVVQGKLLLFLAIYQLAEKTQGQDNFGLVEPFPENIYPVEFTSAQVTCVACDSSGVKTPEKILFMRKNRSAIYTELTADDNLFFTNETYTVVVGVGEGAKQLQKLAVTLHIRNVTSKDDSSNAQLGRYECHAYAVNDTTENKHGFTVSVIRQSEIPKVSVSKASVMQHGDDLTITCNVTGNELIKRNTPLERISWYKDCVLLQSVRRPDPTEPRDTLGPLKLNNVGVRDGGEYTCLLEVELRKVKKRNISDTTKVEIAPWFEKSSQVMEIESIKGYNVSFVCPAKGYPLEVSWKVEKIKDDAMYASTCINETNGKHQIQRKGVYEPYVLTVFDLQYSDAGLYYCCISSKCSSDVSTKDKCQVFNLEIHGRNHGEVALPYKGYLLAMMIFSINMWI